MVTLHEGKQFIINNDHIASAEEAAKLSEEAAKKETLTWQVLSKHNHSDNMEHLEIQFDSMGVYDNTYVGILKTAYASGLKEFPMPCVFTNCHNCLCAVGGTGTLWLDGAQMEESVTASRLNLLDNADFTNGMTCWNPNYDRIAIGTNADADKPSYLSNHVMCMVGGGPGSALRVYQDLPLIGKKGTVFVAGGWSRAQSVPRNGHPERYRMQVQFHSASTGWMDVPQQAT